MEIILLSKTKDHYDVIIVGGGVNGVGIARDCALRGIDCLLVEKNDFSAGTSCASSGMIHGGPRYLLGDVDVTRLSCLDSGFIQKIAPHLLFRIPFLYTVYAHGGKSAQARLKLEAVEAFFTAYDKYVPLKNGKPHTRLKSKDVCELEPNIPSHELVGGITFDEWGIDVPRLCIANVVDAVEHGAQALNHVEVTQIHKDENKVVQSVSLKDVFTAESKTITCKLVINATGPWSPKFGELLGTQIQLRGGKGIHLVFDRRLFNMSLVSQTIDGREIFIMPYENTTIIGTTDDDYFGDLDNQRCTEEEIAYLIDGIAQVFPDIRNARMIYSYSGVRPTIYERDCTENDLSREHEVLDHEPRDSIKGAISLIGGKLASYRIMAKEVTDLIAKKLKVDRVSTTHQQHLPGGDATPNISELATEYQIEPFTVARLVYRHGSRAVPILDEIRANPELGELVCTCEPVTAAEVHYVIKHEFAHTLSDVRRRTRITQGPCQGTECLLATSSILSQLKNSGLEESKDEIGSFMNEWWWNRACVLNDSQLKQEELYQALHFSNNCLDV